MEIVALCCPPWRTGGGGPGCRVGMPSPQHFSFEEKLQMSYQLLVSLNHVKMVLLDPLPFLFLFIWVRGCRVKKKMIEFETRWTFCSVIHGFFFFFQL